MAKRPELPTGYYWRGNIIWRSTDAVTKKPIGTGCTDKSQLKAWAKERERIASDPRHAAASKATLGEWYVETISAKSKGKSEATLRFYKQKLGHFRRLWGDQLTMIEIVPALCDTYVAKRTEEGATSHTIVKEFSCLTQLLKLARRAGKYPHDIAALKPLDLAPKYVPRDRALTADEVKALLSFSSRRLRTFVEITVGLAVRLSEALRVSKEDVDLANSQVRIRGTKTEASDAVIPLLSPMRSLVEDAYDHLPISKTGQYLNIIRDLEAACARAGIERCTPNDLRRTHATLLKEAGVDNDLVRRMLRHTTTRMVETVYGKPRASSIAANIEQHTEALQLTAPTTTETTTVDPWRSRKGKKPGDSGANSEGRTRDLRFTNPKSPCAGDPEIAENLEEGTESRSVEKSPEVVSATTETTTGGQAEREANTGELLPSERETVRRFLVEFEPVKQSLLVAPLSFWSALVALRVIAEPRTGRRS